MKGDVDQCVSKKDFDGLALFEYVDETASADAFDETAKVLKRLVFSDLGERYQGADGGVEANIGKQGQPRHRRVLTRQSLGRRLDRGLTRIRDEIGRYRHLRRFNL